MANLASKMTLNQHNEMKNTTNLSDCIRQITACRCYLTNLFTLTVDSSFLVVAGRSTHKHLIV